MKTYANNNYAARLKNTEYSAKIECAIEGLTAEKIIKLEALINENMFFNDILVKFHTAGTKVYSIVGEHYGESYNVIEKISNFEEQIEALFNMLNANFLQTE